MVFKIQITIFFKALLQSNQSFFKHLIFLYTIKLGSMMQNKQSTLPNLQNSEFLHQEIYNTIPLQLQLQPIQQYLPFNPSIINMSMGKQPMQQTNEWAVINCNKLVNGEQYMIDKEMQIMNALRQIMENEHKCVDMKIFMIVREKLIAYKNVKGSCDVYGINNPMLGDNYMINSIVKVSKNTQNMIIILQQNINNKEIVHKYVFCQENAINTNPLKIQEILTSIKYQQLQIKTFYPQLQHKHKLLYRQHNQQIIFSAQLITNEKQSYNCLNKFIILSKILIYIHEQLKIYFPLHSIHQHIPIFRNIYSVSKSNEALYAYSIIELLTLCQVPQCQQVISQIMETGQDQQVIQKFKKLLQQL